MGSRKEITSRKIEGSKRPGSERSWDGKRELSLDEMVRLAVRVGKWNMTENRLHSAYSTDSDFSWDTGCGYAGQYHPGSFNRGYEGSVEEIEGLHFFISQEEPVSSSGKRNSSYDYTKWENILFGPAVDWRPVYKLQVQRGEDHVLGEVSSSNTGDIFLPESNTQNYDCMAWAEEETIPRRGDSPKSFRDRVQAKYKVFCKAEYKEGILDFKKLYNLFRRIDRPYQRKIKLKAGKAKKTLQVSRIKREDTRKRREDVEEKFRGDVQRALKNGK